jgi:glucan phosphoethanolaminetransferase (alkaline phosphatase superfamily)
VKSPGRALALELAAWFGPAAVFLLIYVRHYDAPTASVWAHLRLLVLVWCTLALARLALRAVRAPDRLVRAVTAAAASALVVGLLLYYALVLIGLRSWGRVISWDLVRAYARQAAPLADALGIGLFVPAALVAAVCLGVIALVSYFFARSDWTRPLQRGLATSVVTVIVVAGSGTCAIEWYTYTTFPPTARLEPFSLTFHYESAAMNLQGHALDPLRAAKLDGIEDAARAAYKPDPSAKRRNLVLIVVDALRPDHLNVLGYARDTTPNLTRMAKERGERHATEMRAACTSSACGIFSIAASKYVHQFSWRPFTLHEVLRRHGYRIHLILGGDHVSYYGLRGIYGEVDSYFDGSMAPWHGAFFTRYLYANDDGFVLDKAAELPDFDGTPVMLQFHLMSAHSLAKRYDQYAKFEPAVNYALKSSSDDLEPARNYYDNGVAQADGFIGRLLDALRRKGYLDNAVVVVTADHGEALGENGYFAHARGVTEEELRIPFIVYAYGYRPGSAFAATGPVSQVDIAPTLLAEMGIARPPTWVGVPLQEPRRNPFSFFQQWNAIGLIDRRDPANVWKYWANASRGDEHAYDLTRDPHARHDSIASVETGLKLEWRRLHVGIAGATEGIAQTRDLLYAVPRQGTD